MDFVSKALGSLSLGLPFTLGSQVERIEGQPWKLYGAVQKKDGSTASVFEYEEQYEAAAQNASAALRKLKLPGIIKYVETVTSGKVKYIVTEPVAPFDFDSLSIDARKFVLQSVLQTLNTLNTVAKCKHNSICVATVMQSLNTGLPVLVGFDLATVDGLAVPAYAALFNTVPVPPEGWGCATLDTYQFGMLLASILPEESRLANTLKATKRPALPKLAASNSIDSALRNPITSLVSEIGQTVLLPSHELENLCARIDSVVPSLYPELTKKTILPELLRTKSASTLRSGLQLIASISTEGEATPVLKDDDIVVLFIVEQFQSMDRVVRLELLRFLPRYIALLPSKVVQQSIMPKMMFGFGDSEVMMRKASVAAIEYLTSKLSSRQLNSELLRLLAKTHNDVDPDVRALTTSVLCRLAPKLDSRSIISTALSRALKDPVPKCRNAALIGVSQIDVPALEIAEKLLGPAATGMLDSDPSVSAEAWRVTDELLARIREKATSQGAAPERPEKASKPSDVLIYPPPVGMSSRVQTPDAPSAVPTPLSTLRKATVVQHTNPKEDIIEAEADTWGWNNSADSQEGAEDAWGWDDQTDETVPSKETEVDEDAWGW